MVTARKSDIDLTAQAPTKDDAQLILQLAQLGSSPTVELGGALLWTHREPLTNEQFEATYKRGSQEETAIYAVLKWYETVGTLVKQGLLNRTLVYDWLWVVGMWDKCKNIALANRAETGSDAMWENFEALAEGQRAADAGAE